MSNTQDKSIKSIVEEVDEMLVTTDSVQGHKYSNSLEVLFNIANFMRMTVSILRDSDNEVQGKFSEISAHILTDLIPRMAYASVDLKDADITDAIVKEHVKNLRKDLIALLNKIEEVSI